ncbi:MAG: hypothetical protein HYZ92_01325 [Candidatus Omnitrophica bacterium]|nr:hypothetical protein [Candidatus Omnitrophota bacterium]
MMIFFLVACHLSLVAAEAAHVEQRDGLRIAYLEGAPYELGRQHGELLRDDVRALVRGVLGYFRDYLKLPLVDRLAANWWLDRSWSQSMREVPRDYLDELRGLSEGSGVPLRELWRLHAIPDRTYACSGFVAWARATADGRLIHARNLDWNFGAGVQRYATVFVVRPTGKRAFVNIGWAGFIGVLSGVNEDGLSVGQVGAESVDVSYRGIPMVFLTRQVMEQAEGLDGAVALIGGARRTVGVNYLIGDAMAGRGVVMETTRRRAVRFDADDPQEHRVAYARPLPDVVVRADTAVDPRIRDRQVASRGNPRKPGLEPPGGSAYELRYLGQAAAIQADYGRITPEIARRIAQSVAPESNIQSVIFAWPEAWVANAQGATPAAQSVSHHLDLKGLLGLPSN